MGRPLRGQGSPSGRWEDQVWLPSGCLPLPLSLSLHKSGQGEVSRACVFGERLPLQEIRAGNTFRCKKTAGRVSPWTTAGGPGEPRQATLIPGSMGPIQRQDLGPPVQGYRFRGPAAALPPGQSSRLQSGLSDASPGLWGHVMTEMPAALGRLVLQAPPIILWLWRWGAHVLKIQKMMINITQMSLLPPKGGGGEHMKINSL